MAAIQAALFLASLVIVSVEPNAERSYYDRAGDPRSCDVGYIVESPDTQLEQQDAFQATMPGLSVVGMMPAAQQHAAIIHPPSATLQDRSFRLHFVTSIWCSSDL